MAIQFHSWKVEQYDRQRLLVITFTSFCITENLQQMFCHELPYKLIYEAVLKSLQCLYNHFLSRGSKRYCALMNTDVKASLTK